MTEKGKKCTKKYENDSLLYTTIERMKSTNCINILKNKKWSMFKLKNRIKSFSLLLEYLYTFYALIQVNQTFLAFVTISGISAVGV